MNIPKNILPLLQKITTVRGCDLEFWNSLEGDELIDMMFKLSGELMMSDIDEDSIPEGYVLLAYIFYWETNCLFSGWYAIENKRDEMDKIIRCYRKVGLNGEADALVKAVEVWFSSKQNHERVGTAYHSVPNDFEDEGARLTYLADYFARNADNLLYA
ncbi:hypothetical protein HBA55_32540 [Pseudomaricurvus alkylphenolicus]|uniref:hypothetical protein n=1 Tax=Pseudomaricurvus alkylphenolicus TaxID=1306991 RepID=UPI00142277FD|nr:hypothetical protein [Pseudomaricurvus alkylphenolicus]NIB44368.1 hypothetical protein [Pseudomaricurvus alkylphenolicus]